MSDFAYGLIVGLLPLGLIGVAGICDFLQDQCGETARASRARNARRDRYTREFLTYGYDLVDARRKAEERMEREAKEAEAQ